MFKMLDAPISIHLELNTACNHRCLHCYNYWRGDAPVMNAALTPDLADDIVRELAASGVFFVTLTGGEPLLNLPVLLRVIRGLRAQGIDCNLNTNLSLLTEQSARDLRDAGLGSMLTSLLSCDPATHDALAHAPGSYERVVRGIRVAVATGMYVSANMVVSRPNLGQVEETGRFAAALGIRSFAATRVVPPRAETTRFPDEIALDEADARTLVRSLMSLRETGMRLDSLIPYPACFLETPEEYATLGGRSCSAGKTSLVVGATGEIRACPHHEKSYGALPQDTLRVAWERMTEWRDGSLLPAACTACVSFANCGGGCRMCSGSVCGEDRLMHADHTSLPQTHPAHVALSDETRLRVSRRCRFRLDRAIGIVFPGGMKSAFVTHDTLTLLRRLHGEDAVFTPATLRTAHGVATTPQRLIPFLAALVERSVLHPVD